MTGIREFSHKWTGCVISASGAGEIMIWAFVPYAVREGRLEGFDFDTLQTKRELAHAFRELNLAWIWQPVVDSNIDAVIEQVAGDESIVLNLCDGIGGGGTPGQCVVRALERAGIRFTGADSQFYEASTSKLIMKEMMVAAGVPTPVFEAIPLSGSVDGICERVGTPLLVKPDISAASGGIFLRSKVSRDEDVEDLRDRDHEMRRCRSFAIRGYFLRSCLSKGRSLPFL